jgi:hypothetical protein
VKLTGCGNFFQETKMTVEEVMGYRRAVPFRPFALILKDGRRFSIWNPEAVGRNEAYTRVSVAERLSGESFDISLVSHVEVLDGAEKSTHGSVK